MKNDGTFANGLFFNIFNLRIRQSVEKNIQNSN